MLKKKKKSVTCSCNNNNINVYIMYSTVRMFGVLRDHAI